MKTKKRLVGINQIKLGKKIKNLLKLMRNGILLQMMNILSFVKILLRRFVELQKTMEI